MKVALVILGLFAAAHCVSRKEGAEADAPVVAKTETSAQATKTSGQSMASSFSGNMKREVKSSENGETLPKPKDDKNITTRGVLMVKTDDSQIVISKRSLKSEDTDTAKTELSKDGQAGAKGAEELESSKSKVTRDILQKTTAEGGKAVSEGTLDVSGQVKGSVMQETSSKGDIALATGKLTSKGGKEEMLEEPALASPKASTVGAAEPKPASPTTIKVSTVGEPQVSIHKP